jgi:hypothetical protein
VNFADRVPADARESAERRLQEAGVGEGIPRTISERGWEGDRPKSEDQPHAKGCRETRAG